LVKAGLLIDLTDRTEPSPRRRGLRWVDSVVGPKYKVSPLPTRPMVDARRQYRDARKMNWRAVRWLMLFDLDDETSSVLRAEYGGRADTYHALGGSRYAVLTATAACVVYNLSVHFHVALDHHWRSLVVVGVWVVFAFTAYALLTKGRAATYQVMQEVVRDALRASSRKRPLFARG
jgi:hypothetical protein